VVVFKQGNESNGLSWDVTTGPAILLILYLGLEEINRKCRQDL
jgi:hypothetical protein